jgi:DegV family protein with EDD domain
VSEGSARVAVVTDSTADLPHELTDGEGITVVPLTVILGGRSYLDGVEITADEFYTRLAEPGVVATTSQPAPERFAAAYRSLLEDRDEVVSLHISGRLSGTYAAAARAAEEVDPMRVRVVDTGLASMPLGLCALAARSMAAGGASASEILEQLKPVREAMVVYFMVGTLEHLRRGGRIGRASALVGSVLQVKPVLTIQDGQVAPLERVRTQERALARVIELAAGDGRRLCAFVGHAAAPDASRRIAAALDPIADTLIVAPLGPVVGAHAGPGTVGVGCYPAELLPLGLKPSTLGTAAT